MKRYEVQAFYDEATATVTYVVFDPQSKDAIIIDPVLDYDPASSRVSTESLQKLYEYLDQRNFRLHYVFETHAHADHLSGAQELKKRYPELKLAIGERILEVQSVFKKIYNLPDSFIPNGKQFDHLLKEGEILKLGTIEMEVLYTPGHTPACCSYRIGDAVFTGDALFMPDTGTGRCDFPKGSSAALHESIQQKLYRLPDETRVFVGHDYKGGGSRAAAWESTIGRQKAENIQLRAETSKESYVQMRDGRDRTLSAPRLLLPSLQVNIDGGRIPAPEANGKSYLKIPIDRKS